MATVFDVAKYILHKKKKLSTWKLQKLCYYAQAWSIAWTEHPLFAAILVPVVEGHRPIGGQGVVEPVHDVVDALVHGLDSPVHIYLPLELLGVVDAGEGLQLANEGAALSPGDEFGGLHRIHQQLQLGQFEDALP